MSAIKKRIVIDARPLARSRSGIRRYLENVLANLPDSPDTEWILYSDYPIRSEIVDDNRFGKCRFVADSFLARLLWNWKLVFWLKQDKPDSFWGPRHHLPWRLPGNTRKIVTIHDMVWATLPQTMRISGRWAERLQTPRAIRNADRIIAVSKSTASDIERFFPEAAEKVITIRHGAPELPDIANIPVSNRLDGLGDYFLSVGTVEPRKNYEVLLDAYSLYLDSGGNKALVIAGTRGWGWKSFSRKISKLKLDNNVVFIEDCNDIELAQLYKRARCFVMLSLGEGYGLPVLEAMDYNLPMVLSDLPVFHELHPDGVLWVDPNQPDAIAKELFKAEALEHFTGNEKVHSKHFKRVPKWDEVAVQVAKQLLCK